MKALLVYKKSTYDFYVVDNEGLNLSSSDIANLKESHDANEVSIRAVESALNQLDIEYEKTYRATGWDLSTFAPDLVIAVGGDGTFIEASRIINDSTRILGVNSDPSKSYGNYCKSNRGNILEALQAIQKGEEQIISMPRLRFWLNEKEYDFPAMNDLLIHHACPAGLTRYKVSTSGSMPLVSKEEFEEHFCSGIWISSPSGTTGATSSFNGPEINLEVPFLIKEFAFQSYGLNKREKSDYKLERGVAGYMKFISKMREGKIYVDGQHVEIDFPYNSELRISSGYVLRVVSGF
jgi:NAD+ kinase